MKKNIKKKLGFGKKDGNKKQDFVDLQSQLKTKHLKTITTTKTMQTTTNNAKQQQYKPQHQCFFSMKLVLPFFSSFSKTYQIFSSLQPVLFITSRKSISNDSILYFLVILI